MLEIISRMGGKLSRFSIASENSTEMIRTLKVQKAELTVPSTES
jgi:hypothetical protein